MTFTLQQEADYHFSLLIRSRDANEHGIKPCFVCGKFHQWENLVNGHWMKRRNLGTRYDKINCQSICLKCNDESDPENDARFEAKLREVYGDEIVDDIAIRARKTHKISEDEYRSMIMEFKSLTPIRAIRL